MSEAIDRYVKENETRFLEELKDFLRIPSISTLPENKEATHRAADFVVDHLWAAGFTEGPGVDISATSQDAHLPFTLMGISSTGTPGCLGRSDACAGVQSATEQTWPPNSGLSHG